MSEQPRHHGAQVRHSRLDRARKASGVGRQGLLMLVLLLAVGLAGALSAAPASAHARFVGSDPADGAVLAELPDVVVMSYSEDVAPQFVDTAVVPPGGEPQVAEATVDGVDVSVDVAGAVTEPAAGQWQVVARVVSVDGHPVEHTVTFVLEPDGASGTAAPAATETASAQAPTATETPAGSATESTSAEAPATVTADPVAAVADELPGWVGVLLVLALLAAGAAVVVVQLRRRPPGD